MWWTITDSVGPLVDDYSSCVRLSTKTAEGAEKSWLDRDVLVAERSGTAF